MKYLFVFFVAIQTASAQGVDTRPIYKPIPDEYLNERINTHPIYTNPELIQPKPIPMGRKEVIAFLENYNRWRRGEDLPMPDPTEIGQAIDEAIKILKNDSRDKLGADTP